MQRTKFKKWRRETPSKHRTFGEKRQRNLKYIKEEIQNGKR